MASLLAKRDALLSWVFTLLLSATALAQEEHPKIILNDVITTTPIAPLAATPVAPIRQNQLRGTVEGLAQPGQLLGTPRFGRHPGFTRAVLDLPPGTSFTVTPQGRTLRVDLHGVSSASLTGASLSDEIPSFILTPAPNGATFILSTRGVATASGWRGMLVPASGTHGARLVLDVSPALANTTPLPATAAIAPLPRSTVVQAQQDLTPPNVLLDAGHGGRFPGAATAHVTEKDLTLRVTLKVRDLLVAAGIHVRLTRESDTHLHDDLNTDLRLRPATADANTKLFVSIHANSIAPVNALRGYGIETWWNPNHPHSEAFARTLQHHLLAQTGNFSRGVKNQGSLAVLRHAKVPAALVEMGFMSHPVDSLNLLSDAYLDRVSFAIAQGIRDTLAKDTTPLALH